MTENPKYNELLQYLSDNQESISCPICSNQQYKLLKTVKERGGFTINAVICMKCGHIYLNPRPTLKAYDKFYFESHYRAYVSKSELEKINQERMNDMQKPEYIHKRKAHGFRLYDTFIKDVINKDSLVVDFGCGDGAWLQGIKEKSNCRISGSDPDLFYKNYIKSTYGFDIHIGVIENLYEELKNTFKEKIRVAIVSGSLQHMVNPMECLQFIWEMLEDDGYIYICNKNIFTHKIYLNIPFSKHISIDHPHYFHKSSYQYMVQKAGFKILNYNDNSQVRDKHMEIFAQKSTPASDISPMEQANEIISKIKSSELKIPIRKIMQSLKSYFK